MTEPDDLLPAPIMDAEEQQLADLVYQAVQDHSNYSYRSKLSGKFHVGISDIGFCSERVRRQLAEIPLDNDPDVLAAFLGTAVGDHIEQAMIARYPNLVTQAKVQVELKGDGGLYQVSGHPDLVFTTGVMDIKSVDGLERVKRTGANFQQLVQRHCYTLGAFEAGLLDVDKVEDAWTANLWVDRSGRTKEFHVQRDQFSWNVIEQAAQWLDEVVYSHKFNQIARKEPPRELCAVSCGYYADCRALDTDVSGLITDPDQLVAVDLYREGSVLESKGRMMKSEAKNSLVGVNGSTGQFNVRWTWVNPGHVSYDREGYSKLTLSKMPEAKRSPTEPVDLS